MLDVEAKPENPIFKRALMQSGAQSTVTPSPLVEAEKNWDKLCQHWGVEDGSSSGLKVEALRHISATGSNPKVGGENRPA
jgi:carboxylesterase type B